jgi:hypothetical protein
MKVSGVFSFLLLVTFAASRRPSEIRRMAKRQTFDRSGLLGFVRPVERATSKNQPESKISRGYDDISSNWAGLMVHNEPKGEHFTKAVGTFTVTNPTKGSDDNTTIWAGSMWVGFEDSNSILQAGVDQIVNINGTVSINPWFEWYPADSIYVNDFVVNVGDNVTVTVIQNNATSGTMTLDNISTRKSISQTLDAPDGLSLNATDADFIYETFFGPYPDFGTVEFTGCSASTEQGTFGVKRARIYELKPDDHIVTRVNITSSSTFEISYIG